MSGFQTRSASAASQGGTFSKNPAHLPLVLTVSANNVKLKYAQSGWYLDDTNGGVAGGAGTSIARSGAVVEIAAADTWTTVCDVTGSGFLTAAIAPTYNISAVFAPSLRITVDGVEHVFTAASAPAAYSRLVLGGMPNIDPVVGTTTSGPGIGDYNDLGFGGAAAHNGIFVADYVLIPSPQAFISLGGRSCRFDQSLKVEAKCSQLGSTAANKAAYAVYQLDKNS